MKVIEMRVSLSPAYEPVKGIGVLKNAPVRLPPRITNCRVAPFWLEGIWNVRVIGYVERRFTSVLAAGDALAAVGERDPILRPVPCGQEIVGMFAALGCPIIKDHCM